MTAVLDRRSDAALVRALETPLDDQVAGIEAVLKQAEECSPRARELAARINEKVAELETAIQDLQAVVEHERRAAECPSGRDSKRADQRAALVAELTGSRAPTVDAEPTAPAVEPRVPAQARRMGPVQLTDEERRYRAVSHFLFDARVRAWARGRGDEVGSRGPIRRDLVSEWLDAHPRLLAEAKLG